MTTTGLVYDDIFLQHDTGAHPESPARLRAIRDRLIRVGLWDKLYHVPVRPATLAELTAVHSRKYVQEIEDLCKGGGGVIDADTVLSKHSYEAAVKAVGGCIEAAAAIMAGTIKNAFCAVRPPGHHAVFNAAMGFCVFNNVALIAKYLQQHAGIEKILIVDWDIHHGNATQETFYDDPDVFFFSIHGFPMFPGTGKHTERGIGAGSAHTLNVPIPPGADREEYMSTFRATMQDIRRRFTPDFILIDAGFDTYKDDPVGGLGLELADFVTLTEDVMAFAGDACDGRIISVLEGGYHLTGLALAVEAHLRLLSGILSSS